MITFKQFLEESKTKFDPDMVKHAVNTYRNAASDLPREGRHHYDSAHDFVGDSLSDKYHKTHPKTNFSAVAKHALKGHVPDDRKESRAYEKKLNRPPKVTRPKMSDQDKKIKKLENTYGKGITKKPRRGIGSY